MRAILLAVCLASAASVSAQTAVTIPAAPTTLIGWTNSSLDEQHDGYLVFVDGDLAAWTQTTSAPLALTVGTHTVTVRAVMAGRGISAPSTPLIVNVAVAVEILPEPPTSVTSTPIITPAGPTTVTDDFAGATLAATWVQQTATPVVLSANQQARSPAGAGFVFSTATTWGANQSSAGRVQTSGGGYTWLTVRASGITDATRSAYALSVPLVGAATANLALVAIRQGVSRVIAGPVQGAVSDGDLVEVRVIGSTITGWLRGEQILTASDAGLTSGDPGFGLWGNQLAHWIGTTLP